MPDAAPEITHGRTMVPFRAIAEEMGFTVSYDNGAIVGSDGETSVAFTVGETACVVKTLAGEEAVTMDTAPYIKEDRTYVPVRFFAEAMGMTVAWDDEYKVAVIYDKEAVIEEINQDFTVYNSLLTSQQGSVEMPEDFEMMFSMGLTITEISSLDGNRTYPLNFDVTVIKEGNKMQGTMLLDLYELFKLTAEESGVTEEHMEAALMGMEPHLKNMKADLILNLDEGKMYLHCPILHYVMSMDGSLPLTDVENTWFMIGELPEVDLDTLGMNDVYQQMAEVDSVGELLLMIGAPEYSMNPSKGLEELMEIVDLFEKLFGDSVFVQKGDVYTVTWDYTLEELAPSDVYVEGGYLKGTMSLNIKTGAEQVDFECRINDDYEGDVLMKVTGDTKGYNGVVSMMVHQENSMILEMEIEMKMTDVKTAPLAAPPAGATIIDISEL